MMQGCREWTVPYLVAAAYEKGLCRERGIYLNTIQAYYR